MAFDSVGSSIPPLVTVDDNLQLAGPLHRPHRASATPFEQRDITVHGLRLRYVDVPPREDEADLPLLLIHGHGSRIEEYDAIVPTLRGRRRVLVPDLPGSGYSDKPDRRYDLALFEDSLLGFLDAMGLDRVHIAGGSMGGNLALRLAHREPERFERIAAWAPAGAWEPMWQGVLLARLLRRLPFMFWPSLFVQSRFWYRRDWSGRDHALQSAWSYFREVYGDGFCRMYWDIGEEQCSGSLFERAPGILHPTYIAYGDLDTGLGLDRGVPRLAALLPRASLRVFQGARHALANEVPEELSREVDAFLRDR